jgi:hypothetical protein
LAYPLKDKLNSYSDFIRQYVPSAAPLAVDPKDDKMVTDKEQKDKNFAELKTGTVRVNTNGRKPVMQIQSASVQALYFKCGNKLTVNVPALGAQYKPSFSASGAAAIPGAQKGEVTLVPNSREVTLSVSSAGNPIGSQTFQVRFKPDIKIFVGGREANEKQGTPGTAVRNMQIRAIPDASFATFLIVPSVKMTVFS